MVELLNYVTVIRHDAIANCLFMNCVSDRGIHFGTQRPLYKVLKDKQVKFKWYGETTVHLIFVNLSNEGFNYFRNHRAHWSACTYMFLLALGLLCILSSGTLEANQNPTWNKTKQKNLQSPFIGSGLCPSCPRGEGRTLIKKALTLVIFEILFAIKLLG